MLPRATERIRRRLAGCGHGDRRMVAIISAVLTDGLLAWKPHAPRRSARASTPPMSPSTSLARRRAPVPSITIVTRRRCDFDTSLLPTAPAMTAGGVPSDGAHRDPGAMGLLKLLGMRSAFDKIVTTAVMRQHKPQRVVRDLLGRDQREAGSLDQVPDHRR